MRPWATGEVLDVAMNGTVSGPEGLRYGPEKKN